MQRNAIKKASPLERGRAVISLLLYEMVVPLIVLTHVGFG